MTALGRYDSSLQMYVSEPREVSTAHLEFLRWLAERDRVTRGPSSGPFAPPPCDCGYCRLRDEVQAFL